MLEGDKQKTSNGPGPDWTHDEWADLIQRLTARRASFDRYTVHGEVGHGGMGRVLHVRDEDLHRDLAMKVMKTEGDTIGTDPSTPTMMRARFVEEAQVAGQLDHPGIVPVHDVGLDADGKFYFTMKLVRGRTLEKVIGLAREGAEGWSLTRVLNALLRVCEAMSYAHERGVLHRDLKPANVMIGNHGEVYVMDWGLARLVGRPERPQAPRDEENSEVRSARMSGGSTAGSSLFLTQNDQVVGTPSFMSPEQAEGAGAHLDARADVYSAGAMLYMALTGIAPYCKPGKRVENRAVWVALQAGPPTPVSELAPKVAPELASICEKAMARSTDKRYATMAELAEDLRAYLEMRVVHAHRTGPVVEFKKWVRRNKKTAAGLLLVIGAISVAGFAVAASERARARDAAFRADIGESVGLLGGVDSIGAIHPRSIGAYDQWLASARRLVATIPMRETEQAERAKIADSVTERAPTNSQAAAIRAAQDFISDLEKELKHWSSPAPQEESAFDAASRASAKALLPEVIYWHRNRLGGLEAALDKNPILRFTDSKLQARAAEGHELLHNLRALERALPGIDSRVALARDLTRRTIEVEAEAWKTAIASIADRAQCPLYDGLVIVPQIGLVPLRRDPKSTLWEFWHVLSGERPAANEQGNWIISPRTGMVLVLVPGGSFEMGAQAKDKAQRRYDSAALPNERLHTALLDPYFISKYEMTQGQWLQVTGEVPSKVFIGRGMRGTPRASGANPVENISWNDCETVLALIDLKLPTEMQWERAARGGTDLPYVQSAESKDVYTLMNLADGTYQAALRKEATLPEDGYAVHAPVDAFTPNGFGLYNVLGNVSEWSLDWYADKDDDVKLRDHDGLIDVSTSSEKRSYRGGSFSDSPDVARVSKKMGVAATYFVGDLGVRPARQLDR